MYFNDFNADLIIPYIKANLVDSQTLVLILVGEKTPLDLAAVIASLNQHNIPFVGGVFPGVIVGKRRYESGIAIDFVQMYAKPIILKSFSHVGLENAAFSPILERLGTGKAQPTALILVDGLTTHIEMMLRQLFKVFGNKVTYVGGGAGSLSFVQKPCLFDNDGTYQDAAIFAPLNFHSRIGVRHGWRDLRGPFLVNLTKGNVILDFDGQPAFKKYSEIIKIVTGKTLTKENFFSIAKGYPLGLYYKGVDRIVRDPITFTDEGGLVCVGEVPNRSLVYILKGKAEYLVNDANRAAHEALGYQGRIDHCFVVDCISRVLFLEDQFGEELESVTKALPPSIHEPVGILSLGEIGSYATGSVEFFNKTIVVCGMTMLQTEALPTEAIPT
jgi:hypothetical protein